MDIFKAFATDETKETQGAWFDVPGGDARVLVARSTNQKYNKAVLEAYEKYAKADKNSEETRKQQEADFDRVIAQHLLLGWQKIEYKGKPMEYSVENACTLLAHRDFRMFVQKCADDFEAYRVEIEEHVGNS